MKKTLRCAANVFLKNLLVTFMSFCLCLPVNAICMAVFAEDIGYTATVLDTHQNEVETYHYYYADSVDTARERYAAEEGYTIETLPLRAMTTAGTVIYTVTTQCILLILLAAFVYTKLWKEGFRDANAVHGGRLAEDKLHGLKIGLLATIPYLLAFAAMVVARLNGKTTGLTYSLYILLNFHFSPILRIIWGNLAAPTAWWQFMPTLLLLGILPLITAISYIIGYRGVFLSDKLTYERKEK